MQVTLDGGTIKISEEGLREVLAAVDKAKAEVEFITDPMPDGDMEVAQYNCEKMKRGLILVTSPCSQFKFQVLVDTRTRDTESMGWAAPDTGKSQG